MDMAEKIIGEIAAEFSKDRTSRRIEKAVQAADFFFNREYYVVQKQLGQNGCEHEYN